MSYSITLVHKGSHHSVVPKVEQKETIDQMARRLLSLNATDSIRLIRAGLQLDGDTAAVLLGGTTILVISTCESDKPLPIGNVDRRRRLWSEWVEDTYRRWFIPWRWWRDVTWDFAVTMFHDRPAPSCLD